MGHISRINCHVGLQWLKFNNSFICLHCGRLGFYPWVGKIPWRRKQLPTPAFWPREFHGLYIPWGHKESDTTEWLSLKRATFKVGLKFLNFSKMTLATMSNLFCNFQMHWRRVWSFWASQVTLVVKNPPAYLGRHRRCRFHPWVGKYPWRRAWHPTPVFLLGESHGQRSLEGYSPCGCRVRQLKWLSMHAREVFMLIERSALCFVKLQNASLMSRTLGGRWRVGQVIGMKWPIGLRDGCLGEPGKLEVLAAAVRGPCFGKSSHPGRKGDW